MTDVPTDVVRLPMPVVVPFVDVKLDPIKQQSVVFEHEVAIDDDPRPSGRTTQSIEDVLVCDFKSRSSQYAMQVGSFGTAMDSIDRKQLGGITGGLDTGVT